ncbi:hypothetical protein NT6N_00510 [Oceaniferula spumae]|uniref:HTH tetR-type domain-containing protein n=1 Tax=Oceaniferula spumae TaxID=2979115 RepID=A0AAT9FGA3_9BACT
MATDAKEKLIESAIRVFAEQGFRAGKVADIVKGAGANIAAVNYHFGSKEQIFVAALRQAFADANEVYPSKGDLDESAPAEQKVAAVARAVLRRSFDEGKAGNFNRIMGKTMHVPGSPVELILNEVRSMELDYVEKILAEYLKTKSPPILEWAKSNFIQLATLICKRPGGSEGLFPGDPKPKEIEAMIEVQIGVILASLKALPQKFPT